jgi:phosphoadenosine phosphosulfate reductase
MMIDEGDVFDEVRDFIKTVAAAWDVEVVEARNTDVISRARKIGDLIVVSGLNEQNRAELLKIGYTADTFPFEPESLVGNHLLKTCAMNVFIREHGLEALATAIRRDEQSARGQESYFSDRLENDPPHMRVHPILHFTERDVWDAIQQNKIPYCGLYAQGYRSLGARYNTLKTSDLPAWEQDLETTPERSGRGQEKEQLMDRLRALGYM